MYRTDVRIKKIFRKRESYIILLTVAMWATIALINDNFALPGYLLELISFNSVYFIGALSILPLMIKGHFDLSIGGMMAMVSLAMMILMAYMKLPVIVLLILGMLLGSFLGLVNGILINRLKVSSVVVTLAMMNIYYGVSRYLYHYLDNMMALTRKFESNTFPDAGLYGNHLLIGLMVLLTVYLLRYHPRGRAIYAFGGDAALAAKKGFNNALTTMTVHAFSGLGAGMAAVIHLTIFGQTSTAAYSGIEFELIIIVIMGGLNIMGGYGSTLGTFFAVIFIVILKSGLVFARISVFWHDMLIGLIILLLISYEMFRHRVELNRFLGQGE